jgi:hypothetical protein
MKERSEGEKHSGKLVLVVVAAAGLDSLTKLAAFS